MPHTTSDDQSLEITLLISLIWIFMSIPSHINPLFHQIISSLTVLRQLFDIAELSFCPGLFDALAQPTPPSVNFFEALPELNVKA